MREWASGHVLHDEPTGGREGHLADVGAHRPGIRGTIVSPRAR